MIRLPDLQRELGVVLGLACGVIAAAQPATMPASRPTTRATQLNLSTPQSAVRTYAEAWRDGDVVKLLACVHASDDKERALVDVVARWVESSTQLRQAARQAFGQAGAEQVADAMIFPLADQRGREMLENLDDPGTDLDITIRGNRARVGVEPVGLVVVEKIADEWKVRVAEDIDPHNTMIFSIVNTVQKTVADGIRSGKYATISAAVQAIDDEGKRLLSEKL